MLELQLPTCIQIIPTFWVSWSHWEVGSQLNEFLNYKYGRSRRSRSLKLLENHYFLDFMALCGVLFTFLVDLLLVGQVMCEWGERCEWGNWFMLPSSRCKRWNLGRAWEQNYSHAGSKHILGIASTLHHIPFWMKQLHLSPSELFSTFRLSMP